MTGESAGPEHRNDRVTDQVSGVASASPLGPMAQSVDDGGRASRPKLVCLPGPPRQPTQATRGRECPHPWVLDDYPGIPGRIAFWATQNALRTGRPTNKPQASTSRSKSRLNKRPPTCSQGTSQPNLPQKEHPMKHNRRFCNPSTGPARHCWPPARFAHRTLSTPHARATSCWVSTCRHRRR